MSNGYRHEPRPGDVGYDWWSSPPGGKSPFGNLLTQGDPTSSYQPGNYPGTDIAVEGTNLPPWTDPDTQWIQDLMYGNLGGPESMPGILEDVRGTRPTPFLERLPWGEDQIMQFIQNRLAGKGVGERADKYTRNVLDRVNRAATGEYDKLRSGAAGTGARGSSSAARQMAEGKVALAGARGEAEMKGMEYEDYLLQQSYDKGMGALGAYEGAARGDWGEAMQGAQLLLQSLGPELATIAQDQQALQNLWQQNFAEAMSFNEFKMMVWQEVRGGAIGSEHKENWLDWYRESTDPSGYVPSAGGF